MNAKLGHTDRNALIAKVLRRARALLRKGWVQGPAAVDKRGHHVEPTSRGACKWCLFGAVIRADYDLQADAYGAAWTALKAVTDGSPVAYNEAPRRRKTEVLAVLDAAIKHAKGRE